VRALAAEAAAAGRTPAVAGIEYWVRQLAPMIPEAMGGERKAKDGYRDFTQGIVLALEPFSRIGTLRANVSARGARRPDERATADRLFRLEELGGSEQVTIVLAARTHDGEKATTVASMAVKLLEHFLLERTEHPSPRRVLLLLDEARRVRGFKANEYITFAREAKAGCVVVYQSLDQIGDEKKIFEILENVGTQVFLGGVAGRSAQHLLGLLPGRTRIGSSETVTRDASGTTRTRTVSREVTPYFTTAEVERLPGGAWPALVYVNDRKHKPFLVDMDQALSPAHGGRGRRTT
jgi:TraM recognition site of TraD and TraG